MKVLVTGAKGFVGQNLCIELENRGFEVFKFDLGSSEEELKEYCNEASFVFHLAGVNRPQNKEEFTEGNADFSAHLCGVLKEAGSKASIAMTSSIQAALGNDYGNSKVAGENALFAYEQNTGNKVYVFRLPNIYGKWCRPNYNSMVATFCYNRARDLDITINDPSSMVPLLYIDDLVNTLIGLTEGKEADVLGADEFLDITPKADREVVEKALKEHTYYTVHPVDKTTVGEVASLIESFKEQRKNLNVPYLKENCFEKKLYSTFLSYLPEDAFAYDLKMNVDNRGSFTEMLRSDERGQVSVNIAKPGITKGNHWHHTKNEKFIVVSGEGIIRFRKLGTSEVIEYKVSGDNIQVVDIPPGYTHNISNVGDTDLVTVMWANEPFDNDRPDTYYLEV